MIYPKITNCNDKLGLDFTLKTQPFNQNDKKSSSAKVKGTD
ncbi:Hypothetical protein BN2458_PEG0037 [Helicobacter typhlonius]|uniref:Uncharacterized protein n=1 Tax=Helicobacter typhlonius TaxID=76936 RepID=A0A0S4PS97_9HELI|nr:Hypothetical protein BN2458_PEG0037 [Helicobacter typhlonius]